MSIKNRIGNSNSLIKQRLSTAPDNFQESIGITSKDDARFRLIEKKREKITDARERLSEIAKTKDVRKMLDKKRSQNATSVRKEKILNSVTKNKVSVAGVGNQFKSRPVSKLRTANSRGVVNLSKPSAFIGTKKGVLQAKTQMKGGSLTRTVNRGISNTNVKMATANKTSSDRYHPLPNNPNIVTIRNDSIGKVVNGRGNQRLGNLPQLKAKRVLQKTPSLINSSGAGMSSRQSGSSRNGLQPMKVKRNPFNPYQGNPSQSFMQEIKPARLKITTPNNYVDYEVDNDRYRMPQPPVPSLKRNSFDDYDQYYGPSKRQTLSNDIVSRLDQSQQVPSSGYKVIVTNLHPVVTGEDIEELFRNIGPIKYARLIREGIAEVLYLDKVDAYRSVEVYHNRQLDGQAMSVTVVSRGTDYLMSSASYNRFSPPPGIRSNYSPPRPFASPPQVRRNNHTMTTSQPSSRPKSVLRAAGGSDYGSHGSTLSAISSKRAQKLDVAPDIHTIHHALFSSKSSGGYHAGNSDPQVVIRLPKGPLRGSK